MTWERDACSVWRVGSTQFLSRDPAVATTRSPYGYVYGNPLNGTDPTGMDCGVFSPQDCISQAGGWVNDHAGTISAVSGTIAVVAAPIPVVGEVVSPIAGGISVGTGALATRNDIHSGNYAGAAFDVLGAIPGVGAEAESLRALSISRQLRSVESAAEAESYVGDARGLLALQEETGRLNNLLGTVNGWGSAFGWTSNFFNWLGVGADWSGVDAAMNGSIRGCY